MGVNTKRQLTLCWCKIDLRVAPYALSNDVHSYLEVQIFDLLIASRDFDHVPSRPFRICTLFVHT